MKKEYIILLKKFKDDIIHIKNEDNLIDVWKDMYDMEILIDEQLEHYDDGN